MDLPVGYKFQCYKCRTEIEPTDEDVECPHCHTKYEWDEWSRAFAEAISLDD